MRRAGAAWKVKWLSEEQEGVLKSPRFEELLGVTRRGSTSRMWVVVVVGRRK